MTLADDTSDGAPKIHSLGLLQPLAARYLDLISIRVAADVEAAVRSGDKTRAAQGDQVIGAWRAAVEQARSTGTAPAALPDGLSAILAPATSRRWSSPRDRPTGPGGAYPGRYPGAADLFDSDGQAKCADMNRLLYALAHTALEFVELKGVNHVLRDDPTDSVANYAKPGRWRRN